MEANNKERVQELARKLDELAQGIIDENKDAADVAIMINVMLDENTSGPLLVTKLQESRKDTLAGYLRRMSWLFSTCWNHLLTRVLSAAEPAEGEDTDAPTPQEMHEKPTLSVVNGRNNAE